MPLRWKAPFGGIAPRFSPGALPPGFAEIATGVDVSSGVLKPLAIADTPEYLWDTTGGNHLVGEIPATEIIAIPLATPAAPTITQERLCQPYNGTTVRWITGITAWVWKRHKIVSSGDEIDVVEYANPTVTVQSVKDIQGGFKVYARVAGFSMTEIAAAVHQITGYDFQFTFIEDSGGTYGGPGAAGAGTYPEANYESPNSGHWPRIKIPLYGTDGAIYAYLSISDIDCPVIDRTDAPSVSYPQVADATFDAVNIVITFALDYVQPRERLLRVVARGYDSARRYSVPSAASAMAVIEPGAKYTVNLEALNAAHAGREIYAALEGDETYRFLVDAGTATTWVDDGRTVTRDELPPWGNYTAFGYNSGGTEIEAFRDSSVLLDGVGVALIRKAYNGSNVRIELARTPRGRLNTWPADWVAPLLMPLVSPATTPTGQGMIRVGGGILVFTTNELFIAHIQSEEGPLAYESLGTAYPLAADVRQVARIGGTAYWLCKDGIAASSGGEIRLVTAGHFTRETFSAYCAAGTTLKSLGRRLILTVPGTPDIGLIWDTEAAPEAALVKWSGGLTGQAAVYKGAPIPTEKYSTIDYVRLEGVLAGTAAVALAGDGGVSGTLSTAALGLNYITGGLGQSRRWTAQTSWTPQSGDALDAIELIERVVHEVPEGGGPFRVTPEMNGGQLVDVHLHCPARARLAAIVVTLGDDGSNYKVEVWNEAGNAQAISGSSTITAALSSSAPIYLKRDFTETDYVRIKVYDAATAGKPFAYSIASVTAYFWRTEQAAPGMRIGYSGSGVAPWRFTDWNLGKRYLLAGLDGSVSYDTVISLYREGGPTAENETLTLPVSGVYAALTTPLQANRIGFSTADDSKVREIAPDFQTVTDFKDEIVIGPGESFRGRYFKAQDRATPALVLLSVNAQAAAGWAGTLTITPDYGSAWTHTLDSAGADASWLAIPIPRASQIEGSVFKVDLSLTSALPASLRVVMRQRTAFPGSVAGFAGVDAGPQPWSAGGIRWDRPVTLTAIKVAKKDSTAVTMRLYENEGTTARTVALTASGVYAVPALLGEHTVLDAEFVLTSGATPADHLIESWQVATLEAAPKPSGDMIEIIGVPGEIQECQRTLYTFGRPAVIVAVQAVAETNGTLRLWADGSTTNYHSQAMASDAWKPAALLLNGAGDPVVLTATTLRVEHVDGSGNVLDFQAIRIWVRAALAKKVGPGPLYLPGGGEFPPVWVTQDIEFTEPARLTSTIIEGVDDTSQTMAMTVNSVAQSGAGVLPVVTSRAETEFSSTIKALDVRTLRLGLTDSAKVAGVWLFPYECLKIKNRGLELPGTRRNWIVDLEFEDSGSFDGFRASLSEYSAATTLTLTPAAGGTGLAAAAIASDNEVRIDSITNQAALANSRRWTLKLLRPAGVLVRGLRLFGRVEYRVKNGLVVVRQEDDPPTWRMLRVSSERPFTPAVLRVDADAYTSMTFRAYSGGLLKIERTVGSGGTLQLETVQGKTSWEFDLEFGEGVNVRQMAVASGEPMLPGSSR